MKMTSFNVTQAPTCKTKCATCMLLIDKNQIRIHQHIYDHDYYYHLACYTPKLKQYIREDDIHMKLNDESKKIFSEWLSNWNSNYFSLENVKIVPNLGMKSITTMDFKYKRAFIEIFKFFEFSEILRIFCLVNKNFYHISWAEEVWHDFYVRDFKEDTQCENWKKEYIVQYNNRCIECKKIPSVLTFYICPMIKKIICKQCLKLPKFEIFYKSKIYNVYQINPKSLDLKFGQGVRVLGC